MVVDGTHPMCSPCAQQCCRVTSACQTSVRFYTPTARRCRQLLMLLFTTKVLNEANALLKPGEHIASRLSGWREQLRAGSLLGTAVDPKRSCDALPPICPAALGPPLPSAPGWPLVSPNPFHLLSTCGRRGPRGTRADAAVYGHEGAAPGLAPVPPGGLQVRGREPGVLPMLAALP